MIWLRHTHVRHCILAAVLTVCLPWVASGQAVVDARRVEFTPSSDHNAVSNGVPVLTRYRLQIYVAGSTTVTASVDLGKPAPGTDGMIRLDFMSLMTTPLSMGVTYESRVAAEGPGGTTTTSLSNQFSFTPTCAPPTLSAVSASVGSAAASGSVNVNAAAGCAWTAASGAAWLTVTAGASGSGPGTVSYSVAQNTSTAARTGTMTIAGQTFTVTQAGAAACSYTIAPTSRSSPAAGETATVAVSTTSLCTWSTTSSAAWLKVSAGMTGTGSGNVSIVVAANTGTTQRTGSVTIAGQTFSVTQAAAPSCSYSINPASRTSPVAGETTSVAVSTGSTCAWSSSSNAAWLSVSGAATGAGSVSVTVAANGGTTQRTGSVTIAGQTFSVTQPGTPACTLHDCAGEPDLACRR